MHAGGLGTAAVGAGKTLPAKGVERVGGCEDGREDAEGSEGGEERGMHFAFGVCGPTRVGCGEIG